jgi:hypothetical protein
MERHDTRRGFVRGALASAVAAGVMAARGQPAAAGSLTGASTDGELLEKLLGVEQAVMYAYRYLIGAVRPSGSAASTLRAFLGHELIHARTLGDELARRGRRPPAPPRSASAVDGVLMALGVNGRLEQIHGVEQALQLLVFVEWGEAGAYHDAIVKLADPALVRLATQILTCEGQQSTVLIELAHHGNVQRAVPHAFLPLVPELAA